MKQREFLRHVVARTGPLTAAQYVALSDWLKIHGGPEIHENKINGLVRTLRNAA